MLPSTHVSRPIRFGVFEVDPHAGELRKQGMKLKLAGQPFDVLAMLLEKPGEIVTREEIQKKLWPADTFVDFDHSLNTAVNKIREALGDSAESPRYVETVPRRGYRFIYPVDSVAAAHDREPESTPHRLALQRRVALASASIIAIVAVLLALNVGGLRDWLMTAVRARRAVPAPKIESIAVLPLENLSGDPEQDYFSDGMTDELITELGQISSLRVISRTSVMRYKGTRKPLPEIARELNVDAIVEGTVRRSADRVRITANLLHAPTDRHLWAESYERDLRDVLKLQSQLARDIAQQIRAKLTPHEETRLTRDRPVNSEAYRLYLQGRYYFFKRTLPAIEKSIQLFQQALEKDPNSALVYAGLSESYGILPSYGGALPKDAFPKAEAAALKAVELDDSLAEAHAAQGLVLLYYDWEWAAAERELKRAIELKPNYVVAHHWYAEYLTAMGRHEQAFAEIRRAQELDPASPFLRTIGCHVYNWARRYDQAIEQCRKALELDPNFSLAHGILAWSYFGKGMYEEAMAEFEEGGRLSGSDPALQLAQLYAAMGRRREALKIVKRVMGQQKPEEISPARLASIYAYFGEKQRALDFLEKAYEQRESILVFLKSFGPEFDGLRSDPRFQDLMRRMNFPP